MTSRDENELKLLVHVGLMNFPPWKLQLTESFHHKDHKQCSSITFLWVSDKAFVHKKDKNTQFKDEMC